MLHIYTINVGLLGVSYVAITFFILFITVRQNLNK